MISMLIYDESDAERKLLRETVKNEAAFATEERWDVTAVGKLEEAQRFFEGLPLLDVSCMEITKDGSIQLIEKIRKKYMEMFLLVIADTSVSPMAYMKPSVMPTSLILRPCTRSDIERVVKEMVEAYCDRIWNHDDNDKNYVIETKDGNTYIPYDQIFYFESKAKKVFVRTKSEEYGFYDTIDNLEKHLPDFFVRCHRSYIINIRKIEKVLLSQNVINLRDDLEVPLSRSYKPILKELGKK